MMVSTYTATPGVESASLYMVLALGWATRLKLLSGAALLIAPMKEGVVEPQLPNTPCPASRSIPVAAKMAGRRRRIKRSIVVAEVRWLRDVAGGGERVWMMGAKVCVCVYVGDERREEEEERLFY